MGDAQAGFSGVAASPRRLVGAGGVLRVCAVEGSKTSWSNSIQKGNK